jgi:hypothetical protein
MLFVYFSKGEQASLFTDDAVTLFQSQFIISFPSGDQCYKTFLSVIY